MIERNQERFRLDKRYFIELILFTLLYYLSSIFGLRLQMEYGGITPIWPPSGIAVAVFWARGKRFWPMIILGEFFIAVSLHQSPIAGITGGAAQLIEAVMAVSLLRVKGVKGLTSSPWDVLWFSSLGALVPPLVSSAIGSTALRTLGYLGSDEYVSGFMTWWLGDAIGILVLAPILVGIRSWPFKDRSSLFAFSGFIASLVLICLSIIFFGSDKSYYLFFILIPFVVIAAIYFRLIGAGSSIILLTIIVYGMRPQDLESGDFITTVRMAFVGTCAFTGYMVTGFMESRQRRMEVFRRQNSYMNTLHELILGLVSHLDIDRLLDAIVSRACILLNTENGFFFQKDRETGKIVLRPGTGSYRELTDYSPDPCDGILGKVWAGGHALMINRIEDMKNSDTDVLWTGVTAVIAVPISVDNDVVGILGVVYREKDRGFTEEDLRVIVQFGELASVAFKNAMVYSELAEQLRARETAEKALLVSEKTHREIFNSTGEAMCVLDNETGLIVQANRAAEEMFAIEDKQPDRGFFSIIEGGDRPYREADGILLLKQCRTEGLMAFEWHSKDMKGDGAWFEITLKTAVIKDIDRVIAVARNIDDRKEAEAHLRQLQTAIDFAGDDIMITDRDGHILYCNPAFEHTTGYSRSEVLGRTPGFLKSGNLDEELYKEIRGVLKKGGAWSGRFHTMSKSGKTILQEASIAPIGGDEEGVTGFVSVLRDITEYERIKNQLLQTQKMEAI